jgi:hypothetical protein
MMQTATAALALPHDTTPVKVAAELYARAGFAPVPVYGVDGERCQCGRGDCTAIGKHPVGGNWQSRARADVDAARELFSGHTGNIGIVVGAEHVVIDADYYHGGREGLASLGEMPPTLTSRSGSGEGEHRIFALAPGQDPSEITNRQVAKGVDVKIRSGQIVVAPSLHRSGNRYQWIDLSPPAPLPDSLYEKIRKRRVVPIRAVPTQAADGLSRRAAAYMAKLPAAVSGQRGHDAAFAAARAVWGWISNKGLPESEGWGLLLDYNQRCSPPFNERELRHKFDQAQKADHIPVIEDRPGPQAAIPAALAAPPQAEPDWRSRLIFQRSKSGPDKPAKHHENAVVVLRYCPEWRLPSGKPRIQFDEHAQRVLVTSPPWHESVAPAAAASEPHEWTDSDTARLSTWIRREVFALDLDISACERAVQIVAEANPTHPFRELLDSLRWDGQPRLDAWLATCLGAVDSPYAARAGRWWLISAVARTYQPGCKADLVLILEGAQGIRKSSALRTLVGDRWFSDTPIDIGSKDAYLALQGKVVVELGELESLKRADADRAKVFFSSAVDQFRPPYGRRTIAVPRSCVFAGTVNHGVYLSDDTGNRRYLPVRCGKIELELLAEHRLNLWAEAVHRYKQGERWWPVGPEELADCEAEQAPRTQGDPWHDAIITFVNGQDEVAVPDVLAQACKLSISEMNRASEMRASSVLQAVGYVRRRVIVAGGDRKWRYLNSEGLARRGIT